MLLFLRFAQLGVDLEALPCESVRLLLRCVGRFLGLRVLVDVRDLAGRVS